MKKIFNNIDVEISGVRTIEGGGTNANTASQARSNLGITPENINASTKANWSLITVNESTQDAVLFPSSKRATKYIFETDKDYSVKLPEDAFSNANDEILLDFDPNGNSVSLSIKNWDDTENLSIDSLKESYLLHFFFREGDGWILISTNYHEHDYNEIKNIDNLVNGYVKRVDVEGGTASYFDRINDASSQQVYQNNYVHQIVLANDSRLTDTRKVAWLTAPTGYLDVPQDQSAGSLAFDGNYLYILVNYVPPESPPGYTQLRWGRIPCSITW